MYHNETQKGETSHIHRQHPKLVVLSVLLFVPIAQVFADFVGPYEPQNWQSAGPGTKTITPASGPTPDITFHYEINYGGGGAPLTTWTFSNSAAESGMVTFNWNYSGFHAFFQTQAFLRVFADGPSGTTTIDLVPLQGGALVDSPSMGPTLQSRSIRVLPSVSGLAAATSTVIPG